MQPAEPMSQEQITALIESLPRVVVQRIATTIPGIIRLNRMRGNAVAWENSMKIERAVTAWLAQLSRPN